MAILTWSCNCAAAAEEVLHALLTTRHVASWRVSGEGDHACFTLHLAPSLQHVTYPGQQQGRWRKKNAAARQQHSTRQRVALPHDGEGAERLALPDVPDTVYESLRR